MLQTLIAADIPAYLIALVCTEAAFLLHKRSLTIMMTKRLRKLSMLSLLMGGATVAALVMISLRNVEFSAEMTRALLFEAVLLYGLLHL